MIRPVNDFPPQGVDVKVEYENSQYPDGMVDSCAMRPF
jgi:hypothetical protein